MQRAWTPRPCAPQPHDNLVLEDGRLVYRSDRPVVLVLGAGWGSHALMRVVDEEKYDVVVVSPRNHFVFTPMLASAAVGSVEFRSVLDPVRVANPHVSYFEATVDAVDVTRKVALCSSALAAVPLHRAQFTFEVPYEHVVVAVGEQPATFGVPGAAEHCFFMKEISDAVALRNRIQEQFELAEFLVDPRERDDALRFVVVGGGPTGVEFAGTLSDFLRSDLARRFPTLVQHVQVVVVESHASILPSFDRVLQREALQTLERLGVQVRTNVRVTEVTKDAVTLSSGDALEYGLALWSAGNATRPLVNDLIRQIPEQRERAHPRPASQKLAVDPYLRVLGVEGAFAIGDCATVVTGPLPPTAQVAGQQGAYVARVLNKSQIFGRGGLDEAPPSRPVEGGKALEPRNPFEFLSLGIMAYIGAGKAVINVGDVEGLDISGAPAFLLWRSIYIAKQDSMRNRVLILADWLKSRVFGRDLSLF